MDDPQKFRAIIKSFFLDLNERISELYMTTHGAIIPDHPAIVEVLGKIALAYFDPSHHAIGTLHQWLTCFLESD